jgi:uncharacterized protein YfaT (DUF1175 family)
MRCFAIQCGGHLEATALREVVTASVHTDLTAGSEGILLDVASRSVGEPLRHASFFEIPFFFECDDSRFLLNVDKSLVDHTESHPKRLVTFS